MNAANDNTITRTLDGSEIVIGRGDREVRVEPTSGLWYAVAFRVFRGERICARGFDARHFKTCAGAERAATRWLISA